MVLKSPSKLTKIRQNNNIGRIKKISRCFRAFVSNICVNFVDEKCVFHKLCSGLSLLKLSNILLPIGSGYEM